MSLSRMTDTERLNRLIAFIEDRSRMAEDSLRVRSDMIDNTSDPVVRKDAEDSRRYWRGAAYELWGVKDMARILSRGR